MKIVPTPAPLVPRLACFERPTGKFDMSDGFLPTDRLHIIRACEDFNAGSILPVLGYCRCYDAEGVDFAIRAYVPGYGTTIAGREALRFPTAYQQEEIFVDLPPFITELDITEYADHMKLERLHEAVIIPMYPTSAHIRMAAAA